MPNVVLFLADDLGYETLAANGGTSYQTPHLDRLAASGVRLDHCYAQPLCTPTRAQIMTGAYNVRNYIRFGYLNPQLKTFGNLFSDAGYATCIVGKWQLGQEPELPSKFGFAEHCLWQHLRRPPRFANPGLEINGVQKDYGDGEYGPKLVNDYALDFIERNQGKPFLLYYPMILTHSPYQPTPDSSDWDPKAMGEKVHIKPSHFGDMVAYMDKMIGRVVTKLEELKLRENTLILFVGDNGTGKGTRSQMGERVVIGGKGSTTKAGMHVPGIVSWPGKIPKGQVTSGLVDTTDVLPTICAAANIQPPTEMPLDGFNLLPALRKESADWPRQWCYCWYSPRQGNDLRAQEFSFDKHYKVYADGRIFDLSEDTEERTPVEPSSLSKKAKESIQRLQATLEKYANARPAALREMEQKQIQKEEQPPKKKKQK